MAAIKPPSGVIAQVRDVFPKLGELTDKVVFGDVWERKGLSKRDRSLIVIASLITQASTEQLRGHLWRALDNGVTREEITEVVTHLAFYTGWPNAGSAALVVKQVFEERPA
jgi:4-carboxymuconolactone decarboxylase